MKFKDHYIGDSRGGYDIFTFVDRRETMAKYSSLREIKFDSVFELMAEIAISDKPKEKLPQLLHWIQSIKRTIEGGKNDIEEFEKSFVTIKNVLEKLDAKCQELTEPKPSE